jgi:hypothetical protein
MSRPLHGRGLAVCGVIVLTTLAMPPTLRMGIMERQQPHATMMANLYAVSDAAERVAEVFAAEHPEYGHVYGVLGDLTAYLPGSWLLMNPCTLAFTEPSGATAAGVDGSVGYQPISMGGLIVGYVVDVARSNGAVLYQLERLRDEEPPAKGR